MIRMRNYIRVILLINIIIILFLSKKHALREEWSRLKSESNDGAKTAAE